MRNFLWVIVLLMAMAAASSDFGAGAVIAWLACMLASVAAKTRSSRPTSNRRGSRDRLEYIEPEESCVAPPKFCRSLNGDPLQRVRKFKRVGSDLVVWLESTPVVVEVKAPLTWSQWGKSLVGLTPASSKPRPMGPVRTKVIMPWDKEKKVWKLFKVPVKGALK
jgi:hypothetical protein